MCCFVIVTIKSGLSYLEDALKVCFFVPRDLRDLKFPNWGLNLGQGSESTKS